MRVQIAVVALLAAVGIAVMLVGGKNPYAIADSQSSTQDGSSGIITPLATIHIGEYAKYGDYISFYFAFLCVNLRRSSAFKSSLSNPY